MGDGHPPASGRWISVPVEWLDPQSPMNPRSRGQKLDRLSAWIDLNGLALWSDRSGLKRGQCAYSLRYLAERWGWSKSGVGSFLEELVRFGELKRTPRPGHAPDVLTLLQYDTYHGTPGQAPDTERGLDATRMLSWTLRGRAADGSTQARDSSYVEASGRGTDAARDSTADAAPDKEVEVPVPVPLERIPTPPPTGGDFSIAPESNGVRSSGGTEVGIDQLMADVKHLLHRGEDRVSGYSMRRERELSDRLRVQRVDYDEQLLAVLGFARKRDRGDFKDWIPPGGPCSMAALLAKNQRADFWSLCVHEGRKVEDAKRARELNGLGSVVAAPAVPT